MVVVREAKELAGVAQAVAAVAGAVPDTITVATGIETETIATIIITTTTEAEISGANVLDLPVLGLRKVRKTWHRLRVLHPACDIRPIAM